MKLERRGGFAIGPVVGEADPSPKKGGRLRVTRRATIAAGLVWLWVAPAGAQVPMVGTFTAEASCFATPSLRSQDNPGRIVTEPGRAYELVGRNAVPGSHYLIRVPGAEPERRWVAYGCGRVGDASAAASAEPAPPAGGTRPRGGAQPPGDYVLAASWHPAFCETRPSARDCRDGGTADGGFSLHGLWPQPRGRDYCGVPARIRETDERGEWRQLPAPELSTATRRDLARVMPGVASGLDRHEWWAHGTCDGRDAEGYFRDAIGLVEALNRSDVGRLFAGAVGRELSADAVRAAFDRAFGRGAGARVLVDCAAAEDGRRLIGEIRIALRRRPGADMPLGPLILAAATQPRGCRGGLVDAPGFG